MAIRQKTMTCHFLFQKENDYRLHKNRSYMRIAEQDGERKRKNGNRKETRERAWEQKRNRTIPSLAIHEREGEKKQKYEKK